MQTDLYDLPISDARPETVQGINDFILGFISFEPRAINVVKAADQDPENCLVNAYAAMLWMFLESPVAPAKARPYIDRALAAPVANDRERKVARAIAAWCENDVPASAEQCDAIVAEYPRDMAMLKLGQSHRFNTGDAAGMLRIALASQPAAADIPYAHGMIAFGYEQSHLLDRAEAAAREAMRLRHDEPWAHHAIAHVMLTQGRVGEGVEFMESVADTWAGLNSFMRSHNWWHLALFYLSQGRHEDVRKAYDTQIWGLAKHLAQDQVGAVSLLARMEFAGVDAGDRWQDVADHVAARGADTTNAFLTLQYLYALGRTQRPEEKVLMEAIRDRANDASNFDQQVWKEVALPAAEGICAYARGDYATAISQLGLALPRMAECGGSHAQRDLFEQIHLDALVQDGRASAAQQVLEMRRTYDPDGVPLNLLLGEVYDKSGLPELAQEARGRAEAARAGT